MRKRSIENGVYKVKIKTSGEKINVEVRDGKFFHQGGWYHLCLVKILKKINPKKKK